MLMRLRFGKPKHKGGPSANGAFHAYLAAVALHNLARNRKPKSKPASLGREKRLENMLSDPLGGRRVRCP